MALNKRQKLWLPYLIAAVGILTSIGLCYVLESDLQAYIEFLNTVKNYLPWITLSLGIAISILIAAMIRVTQLAMQRALTLKAINKDLKKEIKERISAEETKHKLEAALLQGQKLQAMGTLAGGIAHDFNNLLYAIIGYVEMVRDDVEKDSLPYKNLTKVLEGAHRGQELVARILAFSRRQHHQFTVIRMKSMLEGVLSLLRPTIPASVIVQVEVEKDTEILGNQTQIHQVLINIINNAVDAMDGEGTITIKQTQLVANDPYLHQFPETLAENYCKIEITDTGHGMDQTTMERIFDPFFTTKEVGKGTGLGLSIVHSIMKEHQGVINVVSQLGHGTTFTLLLPEKTI